MAGPSKGPAMVPTPLTNPVAERPKAAGKPQELRDNTSAASADNWKRRFIERDDLHAGYGVKRQTQRRLGVGGRCYTRTAAALSKNKVSSWRL